MNMFDPATAAKKKALTGVKKTAQTVRAAISSPTAAPATTAAAAAAAVAARCRQHHRHHAHAHARPPTATPPSQNIKAWVMEFLPEPIRPEIQSISIAEFQCGEYSMNFARSPWAILRRCKLWREGDPIGSAAAAAAAAARSAASLAMGAEAGRAATRAAGAAEHRRSGGHLLRCRPCGGG